MKYFVGTVLLGTLMVATAHGKITGTYTRAQIRTSPFAISGDSQDGATASEARMKAKAEAEFFARKMQTYSPSEADDHPYDVILRVVGETCAHSTQLQMEGERITYDTYTSLNDGNTYVQATLTFKYKCPELSHP